MRCWLNSSGFFSLRILNTRDVTNEFLRVILNPGIQRAPRAMESFGCCCDAKKPDEPIQIVHQPPEPEPLDCKWQGAHSSIETSKESCGSELTGHLNARELRLQSMNLLEVDVSIIRRISVAASLRARGRLWLSSPADLDETTRSKLWHKSQPGDHFDIFFSHSWKTRGVWKVLSLLFQYGWPHILTCWAGVVTLVFILCCFGLLPAPLTMVMSVLDFHQSDMQFTPWVYLSGGISALLSLLFAPYVMHWSPQCFLDVVSINQIDPELTERGIYGLGGFLSVWDPGL